MVHWEGYPTAFGKIHCISRHAYELRQDEALHYPYLLAFEPSFVEIRHVETGHLTQVIQGNNLRCLFADTPPSNPNLAQNSYPSAPSPYGVPQQYTPPQYSASLGYGRYTGGRDEIIMVSDDSVVALRPMIPTDAASMVSR